MTLKHYISFFVLCILSVLALAQTPPNGINYQAVARDAVGDILANQNIEVIFYVQPGATAAADYSETHSLTTNEFGLFTVIIGEGDALDSKVFSDISWSQNQYYLQVEIDGQAIGQAMPFVSVPYAFHAQTVEMDADSQQIGLVGDSLFISNGGHVTLPAGQAPQNLSLSTNQDSILISGGGDGVKLPVPVNDTDWHINGSVMHTNIEEIGIGISTPVNQLHINSFTTASQARFTNSVTQSTALDGLRVGHGSASAFLWQHEDLPLLIGTAGTERIRIDGAGNTGIGINNPQERLHVNGKLRIGGFTNHYTFPDSDGSNNQILQTDGNGVVNWVDLTTGNDTDWVYLSGDMKTLNNGDVGIGVTTEFNLGGYQVNNSTTNTKKLIVSSDPDGIITEAVSSIVLEGSSNVQGNEVGVLDFVQTSTNATRYNHARIASTRQDNGNSAHGGLRFFTRFGANLDERVIIDHFGSMGIGTSSPSDRLHIYNSTSNAAIRIQGGSGGNGRLKLDGSAGNNVIEFYESSSKQAELGWSSGANYLYLYENSITSLVSKSGDIGIGTTTPSAKLDVEGTFQLKDGTEGAGKFLRSDATGNTSWEHVSNYSAITPPSCQSLASVNSTFQKISDLGTFTKTDAASIIEIYFQSHLSVAAMNGANGVVYELRIDNVPTTLGNISTLYSSNLLGQYVPISLSGVFMGLSLGTHTVSIWAQTNAGTATNAMYDPGCWGTTNLLINETY